MAVSNAQKLAKAKYQHEKRSIVAAEVSKEKSAEYRAKAVALGLSLSALIQRGVEAYGVDSGEEIQQVKPENQLTAEERRLVEEFNRLPVDAQKVISKLIKFINEGVK